MRYIAFRASSTAAPPDHELQTFFRQDLDELASEYLRIRKRALEDPGTAGDEGEENWAALLRHWLPSAYTIVTKGRLLGVDGRCSPQIDVIVLNPSYPQRLSSKKVYLASGVAAAFECKITLEAGHLKEAARTAGLVRELMRRQVGQSISSCSARRSTDCCPTVTCGRTQGRRLVRTSPRPSPLYTKQRHILVTSWTSYV